MKKLTLIADVLLISLSAGLFLPNSTINMAKYQSDNNMSLITEKDNIIPGEVMDNQIPDKLYDVGNEDQWYISQAVRRAVDKEEADSFYEKNNGKKYDVIVANILADVIIPLSGIVAPLLKDDGVFITSGIINTMEEAVKEAMLANHFEILEINHMKDWVSITAKKA